MPNVNLDVLKQLLDDFSDKEALCSEEIVAIEQQIQVLGGQIQACRAKLATVAQDKEQVYAIKNRFHASMEANPLPALEYPPPPIALDRAAARLSERAAQLPPSSPLSIDSPQEPTQAQAAAPVDTPPLATPESKTKVEPEEGNDDTVKSINDALRGLFR